MADKDEKMDSEGESVDEGGSVAREETGGNCSLL